MNWLLIFLGGGLGSMARFAVGKVFTSSQQHLFPTSTLVANVISSLLLGLFMGYLANKDYTDGHLRFLIAIGFCGGFSTFSTFSAETFELVRHGMYSTAVLSITANLGLCLVMIGVGMYVMRALQ